MKLFEITELDSDDIIRNSLNHTLSAKSIATVLNKVFSGNFSQEDVLPYVRTVNQALRNINPVASDAINQAEQLWTRIFQDLTHKKQRALPIDDT